MKKYVVIFMFLLVVFSLVSRNDKVVSIYTEPKELMFSLAYQSTSVDAWSDDGVYKVVRGQGFSVSSRYRVHVNPGDDECLDFDFNLSPETLDITFTEDDSICFANSSEESYDRHFLTGIYVTVGEKANLGTYELHGYKFPGVEFLVVDNPFIVISKKAATENYRKGEIVEYTVDIKNNGDYIMKNTKLVETLPSSMSAYASSLEYNLSNNQMTFKLPDILPGDTYTFTIKAKVNDNASVGSTLTATSTVNADYADEKVKSSSIKVVEPTVNISNSTKEYVSSGETFDYNISVLNNGVVSTGNLVLTSIIDSNLEIVDAGAATVVNNTVKWNISNLDVNKSLNYSIKLKPKSSIANNTKITNNTTVTGTYLNSKSVNASLTYVVPELNINIDSKETVKKGETFIYKINIKNLSDIVSSRNLTVKSIIADNLEVVDKNQATLKDNTLTWSINELEALKTKTFEVKVKVKDNIQIGKTFKIDASVVGDNINKANNCELEVIEAKLDISLNEEKLENKDTIIYNLKIVNNNNVDVKNVTISPKLDERLKIINAEGGNIKDNEVTYNIEVVKANSEINYKIEAKLKGSVDIDEEITIKNEIEVKEDDFEYKEEVSKDIILGNIVENPQTGVKNVILAISIGTIIIGYIIYFVKKRNNLYKI